MANDLTISKGLLQTEDSEYVRLVSLISGLWDPLKVQTLSGQLKYKKQYA